MFREGYPFPDEDTHRYIPRRKRRREPDSDGVQSARILAGYFARPDAVPDELADALHEVYPIFDHHDLIAGAIPAQDHERARRTGRWLVRTAMDRCAVRVGLALLGAVGEPEDIPVIQLIGLLSKVFGPLSAHAVERIATGPEALIWLAERVTGWGRVYVVETLCRLGDPGANRWLLRQAVDGDYLNRYFAGEVAMAAGLHEVLDEFEHDPELVEHTGRLLGVMAESECMGMTLEHYPHAAAVIEAHARHA
ncbi:hypothetical protein D5S17_12325 [Pseudonocardiaceae bacterium YIM PH 21723]|nr:hypothetical protein D5S17_12325 [Pseudonocardiaceae bacterium YIM PH 21723]